MQRTMYLSTCSTSLPEKSFDLSSDGHARHKLAFLKTHGCLWQGLVSS